MWIILWHIRVNWLITLFNRDELKERKNLSAFCFSLSLMPNAIWHFLWFMLPSTFFSLFFHLSTLKENFTSMLNNVIMKFMNRLSLLVCFIFEKEVFVCYVSTKVRMLIFLNPLKCHTKRKSNVICSRQILC